MRGYQGLSGIPRGCQGLSGVIRGCQGLSEVVGGCQGMSGVVRGYQRLSGDDSTREREFFIDDQLVRIHLIMSDMFLVDRPRAMGV